MLIWKVVNKKRTTYICSGTQIKQHQQVEFRQEYSLGNCGFETVNLTNVSKKPKSEIPVHDNLVNIMDEQNDFTYATVLNQQSKK